MDEIKKLVHRFGVLPLSQGIVLTLSTVTFAWLARELGPEQYARFAVILLFFSAISLVTDLSPQGYILVKGLQPGILSTARRVSLISAAIGSTLLMVALLTANYSIPLGSPKLLEVAMLCLTLATQAFMQVPRAELVVSGRYRAMAMTDIIGTLSGCIAAILLAQSTYRAYSLVAQLAVTVLTKFLITILMSLGAPRAVQQSRKGPPLWEAVAFGLRVVPLNLASYLSRALDSGLLPSIVSATAAAGYARSYQVVVVPISQLQLSLGSVVVEKFSKAKRDDLNRAGIASLKLWIWLQRIAILSGVLIVLSSSLIQFILFGPRWPLVNVTLSAMATCLPGVAAAAFGAWSTQVEGGKLRTLFHFLAVLTTPISVVATATTVNFAGGLVSLVIVGGLIQPLTLALIHRQSIAMALSRIFVVQFFQWFVVASLFFIVATTSGFWDAGL
ncbi:oligosaccharide flippase family protein [Micrococcaceae bacterium Sec5.7]